MRRSNSPCIKSSQIMSDFPHKAQCVLTPFSQTRKNSPEKAVNWNKWKKLQRNATKGMIPPPGQTDMQYMYVQNRGTK